MPSSRFKDAVRSAIDSGRGLDGSLLTSLLSGLALDNDVSFRILVFDDQDRQKSNKRGTQLEFELKRLEGDKLAEWAAKCLVSSLLMPLFLPYSNLRSSCSWADAAITRSRPYQCSSVLY